MSDTSKKASRAATSASAPLARALDQSEQVKIKVEECADDLGTVNSVLGQEVLAGVSLKSIEAALERSELVEEKVEECADELAQVNDALAEEIDLRRLLERKLEQSTAQLRSSRVRERQSRHDSLHDAVTGLPNMTLLMDRLESAVVQAARHEWRVAVLFLDLDQFKAINDTHGHDVGDHLLRTVATRLQDYMRAGDTVARRSGDEFLVIMLEAKDDASVAGFARQLLELVRAPCQLGDLTLSIVPSIGIAVFPDDGRTAADLLRHADLAMYASKRQQTGVVLFGELPGA